MNPITSCDLVLKEINSVKSASRNFVTNYYLNKDSLEFWLRRKCFFFDKIGETSFFYRKDQDFFHLFYISPAYEELGRSLGVLAGRDEILVADIVAKPGEIDSILSVFFKNSFHPYITLQRMYKTTAMGREKYEFHNEITYAFKGDEETIHDILISGVDRYAEQIPSVEELTLEIRNKNIILIKKEGVIAGFVHYNIKGLTSHLRYWFVNPDFREQRIGSKLLRSYFSLTPQAIRFILWVIQTNDNAIKRYFHYGYVLDNLTDTVLINKENMNYGK